MKILLAGLPGSGKSTQANKIAQELNFHLIQMGDTLRKIAKAGGELGDRIKQIMHTGALVDDETVAEVVKRTMQKVGPEENLIMEGYPRSVEQIKLFNPNFDKVFYLNLSEEEMIRRISDRGRSDDTPETVKVRIEVQKQKLMELLNECKKDSEVIEIDASKSVDEVFSSIKPHLV